MKLKHLAAALLCGSFLCSGAAYAAEATAKPQPKAQPKEQKNQLVTEGEFAKWLVNVLGLSRMLPAAPSEQECFNILVQNSVSPKNGWISTNVVTMGTLARVVVQSMRKQGEIKNPQDDNSWIQYLKTINIEFGTIGQAMDVLGPIDPAYASEAAVTSTDPLRKQARIRPLDEQQFGTDLQAIRMPDIIRVFGEFPEPPKPMTPN